jgi:hypothetical protein
MATIDTLALAERLEREYGDDPERARRHARILGDMAAAGDVATKQDVKDLRGEIGHLRAEMQRGIGGLRNGILRSESRVLRTEMREIEGRLRFEIRSEGDKLRTVLHKEIAAVRSEMDNLVWKTAGLLVAQTVVIVAAVKLLPDF